jgi:hypothetical protein
MLGFRTAALLVARIQDRQGDQQRGDQLRSVALRWSDKRRRQPYGEVAEGLIGNGVLGGK